MGRYCAGWYVQGYFCDLSQHVAYGMDLYWIRRAFSIDAIAQRACHCGAVSRWVFDRAAFDRAVDRVFYGAGDWAICAVFGLYLFGSDLADLELFSQNRWQDFRLLFDAGLCPFGAASRGLS